MYKTLVSYELGVYNIRMQTKRTQNLKNPTTVEEMIQWHLAHYNLEDITPEVVAYETEQAPKRLAARKAVK